MSLLNHNIPNQINNSQIKSMYNMLSKSSNPQAMLNNMIKQNPQLKSVLDMCKASNPKDAFYSMCKQKGVNPDDILNQLK